jgi:hypothetical protein
VASLTIVTYLFISEPCASNFAREVQQEGLAKGCDYGPSQHYIETSKRYKDSYNRAYKGEHSSDGNLVSKSQFNLTEGLRPHLSRVLKETKLKGI